MKISIGVPKETKTSEGRVGLTPKAIKKIISTKKCLVIVETKAGEKSGFSDQEYLSAGASIAPNASALFQSSQIIVKVKEITPAEFPLLLSGQTVFAFLHSAACPGMIDEFLKKNIFGISFDTVREDNGNMPILKPMSQVAGRLAIEKGLEINPSAKDIAILGCGTAGYAALLAAIERGFNPIVLDINRNCLEKYPDAPNMLIIESNPDNISRVVKRSDIVIGAVLVPGANAPKLITRDMLKTMTKGSVIVDISIDQGGCVETSHPTTHKNPTFIVDDVIHYCVANMPGIVPSISTPMLVDALLPYLTEIIEKGICGQSIFQWSPALLRGINTYCGCIVNEIIAKSLDKPFTKMRFIP